MAVLLLRRVSVNRRKFLRFDGHMARSNVAQYGNWIISKYVKIFYPNSDLEIAQRAVQRNPLNGSAVFPTKNGTIKQIETLRLKFHGILSQRIGKKLNH